MRRRTYLTASVVGIAGLAGCSGIRDRFDDSGSGAEDLGPAETVEAFFDAVFAGDAEEANGYIHPDSGLPELTEAQLEEVGEVDPGYRNATVVEREDGVAIVSIETAADTGDGITTTEQRFELRRDDGAWKLYDRAERTGPSAPAVQWSVRERAGDDGRTAAIAFTHDGGETVDVANLRVAVDEHLVGPADGGSLRAGDAVVAGFTAGDDGYEPSTTVGLRWNSPTDDAIETLVEHDLETETTGELGVDFRVE